MIACKRCGAQLEVPLDLAATTVRCSYCGNTMPLPQDVMSARKQERMARMAATAPAVQTKSTGTSAGTSIGIVVAIVGLLVLGFIGGIIFLIVAIAGAEKPEPGVATTPAVVDSTPAAIAKPIASDAQSTGQMRTTALMKQLYDKGCTNVIMPPEQAQGDKKLDTKFVQNGTCVRVLVITGSTDNKLTLAMKNPFGEDLPTPAPNTEIDFTYCPKQSGPHPTTITATNDDFYTVAAVECPKGTVIK